MAGIKTAHDLHDKRITVISFPLKNSWEDGLQIYPTHWPMFLVEDHLFILVDNGRKFQVNSNNIGIFF